jgi:hypothetical protein
MGSACAETHGSYKSAAFCQLSNADHIGKDNYSRVSQYAAIQLARLLFDFTQTKDRPRFGNLRVFVRVSC